MSMVKLLNFYLPARPLLLRAHVFLLHLLKDSHLPVLLYAAILCASYTIDIPLSID